ncbi:MAG: MotA/TolQ/ExbB proton channel family protein [Candidatus Thiodiazotropha endolucinida]|uniref:Biopolymer transport protein ExbB n=1 Tax=Candidatus Thiodiazotropha endolucinida TaxID=1655433 RepID=A0A7Z1AF25_9GAMM|nr:MotA/TolQ/ExbB proton channel family protein [Candidatus Thiodiazotropha endolucinida]MBT3015819.1 MotA/TolQ/ExbB proton channel family protein [Candidatus Thiodiazotropha taylori]MCG7861247.1 MotA/TolQ/ExbB proton channel family protein [Candidatus Thiodiazotropha endolucinida]MCG8048199.1 MotA/TolQ/ExbB proton channel family protein [Candidatus Thiodiazotropha taylori]MCG8059239.1 MotA/TolQ/ExbB proton channel family protein [Candidatus Thiodiazotropha taylori]MCG8065715.1 MotA/TolQ/ExbB 
MSITELLAKGGPVIWILALYSSIGLAIVLERYFLFLRLRQLPKNWMARLGQLLDESQAQQQIAALKGPEANVIRAVVEAQSEGVKDLRGVGERVRGEEIQRMEFGLRTLGILGNTAPLLGLLGTITGMIKAFMVIEQAGGKVDAQALAGGIWEAMITTGVGLAVAIPLLLMLHFLEGSVERRAKKLSRCIALLLERRSLEPVLITEVQQTHQWENITDGV